MSAPMVVARRGTSPRNCLNGPGSTHAHLQPELAGSRPSLRRSMARAEPPFARLAVGVVRVIRPLDLCRHRGPLTYFILAHARTSHWRTRQDSRSSSCWSLRHMAVRTRSSSVYLSRATVESAHCAWSQARRHWTLPPRTPPATCYRSVRHHHGSISTPCLSYRWHHRHPCPP